MNALAVFWVCVGLLTAGCANTTPKPQQAVTAQPADNEAVEALPPVMVDACTWDAPIYLDKSDVLSNSTAQQIDRHNTDGAKRCGWKHAK